MPATPLVVAVRSNDASAVGRLLADPNVDVNESCDVEPIVLRRNETPLYTTTPLMEAVRQRNKDIIQIITSRQDVDVNKTATPLASSPFTDAVSRGDVEIAEFLLRLMSAVDPTQGNAIVAHPALYGAMTGNIELLGMFARNDLMTDSIEMMLLRTAAANEQRGALEYVQNHFLDVRPLDRLTPGQMIIKIRRVFKQFDDDGNGFVDQDELKALLSGLALPLMEDELREAFIALNTAGDNRITLDELTAYILGAERYRAALLELHKTGGYGGMTIAAADEVSA